MPPTSLDTLSLNHCMMDVCEIKIGTNLLMLINSVKPSDSIQIHKVFLDDHSVSYFFYN